MLPYVFIIELFCLGCAIRFLRRTDQFWSSFIWFMLFISIYDGLGWALIAIFRFETNYWLYNIVLFVSAFFYAWIFYNVYKPYKNISTWLAGILLVFIIFFAVEMSKYQSQFYNYYTATFLSVCVVIGGGFYFHLLLQDKLPVRLTSHAPFWIVVGMFLFSFAGSTLSLFFRELMALNITKSIQLRFFISIFLNLILYGAWSYAFRCKYLGQISSS